MGTSRTMIGCSAAFRRAENLIGKVSAFDAPVLIEGETGTGKDLAARAIHYSGKRGAKPFVPVNCGALPEHLIENELFGHRRGAYTDARDDQVGLVALAHNGTLFLDEIDTLTPKAQVVLLRFLQDQQYRPLGSKQVEQANVRIVAASNQDLERLALETKFRLDLFYRLKLMHLVLPPLRERHGDALVLADHFIGLASARFGKEPSRLSAPTCRWFDRYHWPGNIRELENLVYREFLMSDASEISIAQPPCLPACDGDEAAIAPTLDYRRAKAKAIHEFEVQFVSSVIARANGNVSVAARLCGTERRHFGRLLKKHRIPKLFKPSQVEGRSWSLDDKVP